MSTANNKKTMKTLNLLHSLAQSEGEKIAVQIAACQQALKALYTQIEGAEQNSLREEEIAANGIVGVATGQTQHTLGQGITTSMPMGSDIAAVTSSLSAYRAHHTAHVTDLKQSIAEQEEDLLKLHDALTVIFGEQKAYEITQDNLKEKITADNNRKNQIFLDDIASQKWQRRERSQHE
jgi:flagellar biosynthesis chaperone FliJ